MEDKPKKFRSPQFPFIPLERAIERIEIFEREYAHNSARVANAATVWGYSAKSSSTLQTLAALLAYGLIVDEGTLENRKVKVSPLGMTILKDNRPGARAKALKEAALKPNVLNELWSSWGAKRPPTVECVSTLHLDMAFSEDAARRLIDIYDATIAYAGLSEDDKIAGAEGRNTDDQRDRESNKSNPTPPSTVKAGDFVQWESGGVLQFAEPTKVASLSPDGMFVFVEGSMTGLPIAEVTVQQKPAQPESPMSTPQPPVKPPAPGAKQDTFSLDEGQVVLQWPSKMSKDSYADFKDWIELQVRKIGRAVE